MSQSERLSHLDSEDAGNANSFSNPADRCLLDTENKKELLLKELSQLVLKSPDEILLSILNKQNFFLSCIKEKDTEPNLISHVIIALGKACCSEYHDKLNTILLCISSDVGEILITLQHYLLLLKNQKGIDKLHLDALINLTLFLRNFQLILPSTSFDFISVLLPLLTLTCKKHIKDEKKLEETFCGRLREIEEELKQFAKHFSAFEISNATEREKQQLLEPPENYRSLSVLPTLNDIHLSCSFLRPSVTKGRYKNAEHYLDVQFRLLREDYIKPLRDGIAEYLCLKKNNKSLKNCKSVRVYSNTSIVDEEFVKGDLIHVIKFKDESYYSINWENSKRFLTGSLLCLSTNDFQTILFATVVFRDIKKLKEGLLCIHFEDLNEEVLSITSSMNFVVIETSAYFESYCHNLKALQTLNEGLLPMKRYIIDVHKSVQNPSYLTSDTIFDMRPLLIPLKEEYILKASGFRSSNTVYEFPDDVISIAKSIRITDDCNWPSATDLNLDQSQFDALKSAVTKEFAIIQGPPGTGKTYVGLRFIQLMLHNIDQWFNKETNPLPILIVCYTNHALDQFLEGVLLFTQKVVRIGGGGKNEAVANYQISKLVESSYRSLRVFNDDLYKLMDVIKSRIRNINDKISKKKKYIVDSTMTLIKQSDLEEFIPSIHLESLERGDFRQHYKIRQTTNKIADWLKAHSYGETSTVQNQGQAMKNSVAENNVEIEAEGEADIEFIENQRNIDQYTFENIFKKKIDEEGFQSKQKNKLNLKYIKHSLENTVAMKHYQAKRIRNIWVLPMRVRWQLYKYWLEIFLEAQQEENLYLQNELKTALKELADLYIQRDLEAIRGSHIVGMTTTGAAKYRHIIKEMKPAILLVEEAAEILESHIITSLAAETQHVVLIGDQQQLRPSPAVYMLAVKYGMNVSLFERMIKNGVEYCRLSIQHRMRPEIASLIVPHIYSNLENHKIVTEFENIKGVSKNVFFITHNFCEMQINDSKSRVNEHEAKFLIKLCKYLLLQGYKPSQITVLTTYSGQLFSLKKLSTEELKDIRFTVVDNFQGEENDIILISFVRSNEEGEVGFLKVSNRICVALSRAKKGLYCIGNFELLAEKSNLWKNIVHTLVDNKSIGPSLYLVCQNHPDISSKVATDADFAVVPEGGCSQQCSYRLLCGHSCILSCHVYDQAHIDIKCEKPCNTVCKNGHLCPKKCFEICGLCPIIIDRTLTSCGHVIKAPCGKQEHEIFCHEPCERKCEKGHTCPKVCYKVCKPCPIMVDRTLSTCGHIVNVPCGKLENEIDCLEPCVKKCKRGHTCPKKCFEICKPCPFVIDRTLSRCKHVIKAPCGERKSQIKCLEPCVKKCEKGHTCPKKCFEICKPCPVMVDRVLLRCKHVVNGACGKLDSEIDCLEPCVKKCVKGHSCPKKCSESCGSCRVLEDKTLKRCGHTVKAFCCLSEFQVQMRFLRCESQCSKTCKNGHQCLKKCYQACGPCTFIVSKTLPICGHTVKMYCSSQDNEINCKAKCNKILSCGHECTNMCHKTCITKCIEAVEIVSSVCGHTLNVQCCSSESVEELKEMCSKQCNEILPCGHMCKGTCSSCHQGRLHIECQELCDRTLICGHKCQSKCYESCRPCKKLCENRCSHRKCPRKCGDPCVKCYKRCDWICQHRKCSRLCFELCNREPCSERCMKLLPCNHPCIGYCGEPCPKICAACDKNVIDEYQFAEGTGDHGVYIYLEDCKHFFKEEDLKKLFVSSEPNSMKMKTCPKCGTTIRRNVRFNNSIKLCKDNIEKVKILMLNDREENMKIQRSLLEHPRLFHFSNDLSYEAIINVLSSNNVRTIQELVKVGNIINIAAEAETNNPNSLEILNLNPQLKEISLFYHYCLVWLREFLIDNFLTVSDYQLEQLSTEVYRLVLIDTFLKFVNQNPQASSLSEFETCKQCLMNYKPFCTDSIQIFRNSFQNLVSDDYDINNMPPNIVSGLVFVNFSQNWYQCFNGHLNLIMNQEKNTCYECKLIENDSKMHMMQTVGVTDDNSVLPHIKNQDLKNHFFELQSSNDLKLVEKTDNKSEFFFQSRSSEEKDISLKCNETYCEDAAECLNTGYDLKSESRTFLLSLLSIKLNVLLTVRQSRNGLDERIKNSELHHPYRRQIRSETFKGNWNTARSSGGHHGATSNERYADGKTEASAREQAKGSGAVPKNKKNYDEHHYGKREYKSYRDTHTQNPSSKFTNWHFRDDSKNKLENKDQRIYHGMKNQVRFGRNSQSSKDHNWGLKDDSKNKFENSNQESVAQMRNQQFFNSKMVKRGENKKSFSVSHSYHNLGQGYTGIGCRIGKPRIDPIEKSNTYKFKNSDAKDSLPSNRPSNNYSERKKQRTRKVVDSFMSFISDKYIAEHET